jgi:hypothetical protein
MTDQTPQLESKHQIYEKINQQVKTHFHNHPDISFFDLLDCSEEVTEYNSDNGRFQLMIRYDLLEVRFEIEYFCKENRVLAYFGRRNSKLMSGRYYDAFYTGPDSFSEFAYTTETISQLILALKERIEEIINPTIVKNILKLKK